MVSKLEKTYRWGLLGLALFVAAGAAGAADLATELAYDDHVRDLVRQGRGEVAELWGEAGSFGGYAEWVYRSLDAPVDLAALGAAYREEMSRIPPEALAAISHWLSTSLGQEVTFLMAHLATPEGQRELQRSGRQIAAMVTESRQQLLERVDTATGAGEVAAHEAATWLGLLNAAASQLQELPDEEDEWREDLDQVNEGWAAQYAGRRWTVLAYLYARLSEEELESFLSFAESGAGQALFAARKAAALRVVDLFAGTLQAEQQKLLAQAWAETAEERRDDEKEDEEEEP